VAPPSVAEPVPPPQPVAAASPRDQCSGRHLIALHRCMVRECAKPAFNAHPECEKVRALEQRARRAAAGD
jgi:hypothetical protein